MAAKQRDETALKKRARKMLSILSRTYPDARCMLNHDGPLELLVATILAAQCTDARVNRVTPALFRKYRTAAAYAAADFQALEREIRSTGFFRNKARAILTCCRQIQERHGGSVPGALDALTALNGVGRKTAHVVLTECFGRPGIIVDTHLKRVCTRVGLTASADPDRIEADVAPRIPPARRGVFSHAVTFHGRAVCKARKPLCDECPIRSLCDYAQA